MPAAAATSTATDTFLRFVDGLTDALEGQVDQAGTAEVWARELHFSRDHFDRLVRSVAGEPPATLRRRLLIERAAYRLLCGEPVIDVAVEAGYGSHAAFTRAFSRAYGVAPSDWRRRPGQTQIGAPNGVHFHPPAGLRLPARDEVTGMDLLMRMVEHHVWLT